MNKLLTVWKKDFVKQTEHLEDHSFEVKIDKVEHWYVQASTYKYVGIIL